MIKRNTLRKRATCIITNYNYARYLSRAVDSVLSQTRPFDEIVIVDDASCDESAALLSELAKRSDTLKIIRHEDNLGQLAAFETGVVHSNGDIVFFLDADDVYAPDYLGIALDVYDKSPKCDFIFCGAEPFTESSFRNVLFHSNREPHPQVRDLGLTVVRTLERKGYVGAPTSCLSLRRKLVARLFPMPLHEDWRTRADDCLIFGASLAGARKFRIEANLVGYRVHGQNAYFSNPATGNPDVLFFRHVARMRLFHFLRERLNLEEVGKLAHLEFKTIPNPSRHDFYEYVGYVLKNGAEDAGRLWGIAVILKWYLKSRRGRAK